MGENCDLWRARAAVPGTRKYPVLTLGVGSWGFYGAFPRCNHVHKKVHLFIKLVYHNTTARSALCTCETRRRTVRHGTLVYVVMESLVPTRDVYFTLRYDIFFGMTQMVHKVHNSTLPHDIQRRASTQSTNISSPRVSCMGLIYLV